ncbi:MAG TPA: lipid IV(A) 3-deoxy-D-manno-octulosonic acid transferase [Marinospirillum sp.]|uniref:lipid IV(A) 3-deoxy-D-manno-octulosonic acid transferase n=1 Tax=Marinospirillum sp. TaxID=2183934 RepID=UPI002B494385|nr:lipid IV(A) 3-deoxy-D-manno-octulosonic acid transferase [Marinospirillum sp.]HKM14611.1 lipid IV(A) 3-deoxy-D-manno-octulosonic acid transferase [Marinospirillum sp.]
MAYFSRWIYTFLLSLASPWANKRMAREKVDAFSKDQRAGHISPFEKPVIWAHCASMGEVLAAEPLLKALQERHPNKQLVVTTMTATGAAQVKQRLPEAKHFLVPLDLPRNTQRFIKTLKPEVGIIFETELWPNLIHSCHLAGVPLIIANGRLSTKAFIAYKKIRPLMADALNKVALLAAKSADDAERFIILGFSAARVEVTGSIKFDLQLPTDVAEQLAALKENLSWGERPVWIAASTHEGEDLPLLLAHQKLLTKQPDALLILVPRHPQRFDAVAELIAAQGLSLARRSAQQPVIASTQVYLGDTLGEMLLLYALADLAFVAGSLEPIGGHNLLEPAAVGVPVITGPHLENFSEVAELLRDAGALKEVQQADELPALLQHLWQNNSTCQAMSKAGKYVVEANKGALRKQLLLVESLLPENASPKQQR